MTIDEYVGIRIRDKRKDLKMTQEEFAHRVGINRSYVYLIEHGQSSLSIITLERIKDVLGVDYNYFFSGSDAISSGSDANS